MKIMKMVKITILSTLLLAIFATPVLAGYAKDYIPAPPGTDGFLFYFARSTGNEYYHDGDKASNDVNLKTEVGMLRYVHFFETKGIEWDFNALLPIGNLQMDGGQGANHYNSSATGFGDPGFIVTIWPYRNAATRTYFGFSEYIFVPVGQYHSDQSLNMGANRWVFVQEFGFEKGFGEKWSISLQADAYFYFDNDKAFDGMKNDSKLEQDPLLTFDAHLIYDFSKDFFMSADYRGKFLGETELNGVKQDDSKNEHSVGCSMGFMFNPNTQLLLNYMTTAYTENGIKSSQIDLRLGYFF